MILTHKEFIPVDLKYDNRIFGAGLGDVEMTSLEEFAFAPIVETLKKRSLPIATLAIEWHYILKNDITEILHLIGEDRYGADISDLSNIDETVDGMIIESWERLSKAWDDVKPDLGTDLKMRNLQPSEATYLRNELISLLMSKIQ